MKDPRAREQEMNCIPLLLCREDENILLPDEHTLLQSGDRVLFCGLSDIENHMIMIMRDESLLNYIMTGLSGAECSVFCWFQRRLIGDRRKGKRHLGREQS